MKKLAKNELERLKKEDIEFDNTYYTCKFSDSIIKYLSNISDTRKLNLYRNIIELSKEFRLNENSYNSNSEFINKMIKENVNMQKNIQDSKKYVKGR